MCYEIVLLPHTPSARTQAPVANHHTLSPETCLQQFRALALAPVGLLSINAVGLTEPIKSRIVAKTEATFRGTLRRDVPGCNLYFDLAKQIHNLLRLVPLR